MTLKRSGPIKRKPAKRRPPGVGCQTKVGRHVCRRDAHMTIEDSNGKPWRYCAKHAADKLFARHISGSGPCRAQGYRFGCSEGTQCAHVITRARESIRWSDDNAVPLCSGHHVWFTHNPTAWHAFVADEGIDRDGLYRRGYNDPPEDPLNVIARFTEDAA